MKLSLWSSDSHNSTHTQIQSTTDKDTCCQRCVRYSTVRLQLWRMLPWAGAERGRLQSRMLEGPRASVWSRGTAETWPQRLFKEAESKLQPSIIHFVSPHVGLKIWNDKIAYIPILLTYAGVGSKYSNSERFSGNVTASICTVGCKWDMLYANLSICFDYTAKSLSPFLALTPSLTPRVCDSFSLSLSFSLLIPLSLPVYVLCWLCCLLGRFPRPSIRRCTFETERAPCCLSPSAVIPRSSSFF